MPKRPATSQRKKYAQVFETLRQEMQAGRWKPGQRLPSEAALVERFGHSRITIGRALRDLQAAGLVYRRAGSGTFVQDRRDRNGLSFGLLIPDLGETEIFEPICQGMMASPLAREHALVWGSASRPDMPKVDRAWQLCLDYIERRVAGVFFAPFENLEDSRDLNERIARAFEEARIPMVLLDRPLRPYPEPSHLDIIGIDNRRAGYVITAHLLTLGGRRLVFVGSPNAAPTVDAREAGYREAMYAWNAPLERRFACRIDPDDGDSVTALLKLRPEGVVCANDRTAGRLMHALLRRGRKIPDDVRVVGIDDVGYAELLPVPLTTLRQPTRQIGDVALMLMLERIARPDLPPRDTRLDCTLIVRESCGASRSRMPRR